MGLSSFEIIRKHLIPNVLSPIIVNATLNVATGILMEAGISFLGLGVNSHSQAGEICFQQHRA